MTTIEKARNWMQQELGVAVQSMRRLPGSTSSLLYEVKTNKYNTIIDEIKSYNFR